MQGDLVIGRTTQRPDEILGRESNRDSLVVRMAGHLDYVTEKSHLLVAHHHGNFFLSDDNLEQRGTLSLSHDHCSLDDLKECVLAEGCRGSCSEILYDPLDVREVVTVHDCPNLD